MCTKFASAAAAAMLLSMFSFSAQALPAAPAPSGYGTPDVTLVEGGCGLGRHRGPLGGCVRNGGEIVVAPGLPLVTPGVVVVEPRVCPLGSHWSPRFGRCIR